MGVGIRIVGAGGNDLEAEIFRRRLAARNEGEAGEAEQG